MTEQFDTPIAFFIFRRPKETRLVFEIIRNMRPKILLIVADGPRNKDEDILCTESRKIVEKVDWPCKVMKNYSDINLGCKKRVSSGLDWVFENVGKAIVLEDDCLPNQSFFLFCQELLTRYENNPNIMHIGGINIQDTNSMDGSYYFSRIAQIWGWATWRRAWKKYDVSMNDWPHIRKERKLYNILENPGVADYFEYLFQRMRNGELDTWDVAWTYACMKEQGLAIVPHKNLVKNIGFGEGATHTKTAKGYLGEMVTKESEFPLKHPEKIEVNKKADMFTYRKVFGIQSRVGQKILWFIKSHLPKVYQASRFSFQKIKLFMKKS